MIVKNSKDQHFVSTKFIGIQQKLLNKHSNAESKFASMLLDAGMWFRREKCNYQIDNRWSYYDFHIPALDLYIEVDGPEHLAEKQQEIDRFKETQIRHHGHKIIRFTNDEVLSVDGVSVSDFFDRVKSKFKKGKTRKIETYKKQRIIDIAWAYVWQLDNFGEIVNMQDVCLYDHGIGAYFMFDRLYDVNVATSISMAELIKMLSKNYSKRTKKYILACGLDSCQNIASDIFGVTNAPIVKWKYPEYEVMDKQEPIPASVYMEKVLKQASREYVTPGGYRENNEYNKLKMLGI